MKKIDTVELFPVLNKKLVTLLESLRPGDWGCRTQFPSWTVKDICAHLLDTSLRRLSLERDGYVSSEKISVNSYDDLISRITMLADRWATAFSGISPRILIELTAKYQQELYEFLKRLDPYGQAFFPVSWAGEKTSYIWFDTAREYTERWHHQMQIREALGREPLYGRELYHPVLDTFMRALPYHYRNFHQPRGYTLCVHVTGSAGGKWFLTWNDGILLTAEPPDEVSTEVRVTQDAAWKICTRWEDKSAYKITYTGSRELAEHLKQLNCLLIKT